MNKKAIITVLLALISLGANAQLASVKELSMQSEYFGFERQVLIYMPVGYQEFDQTYYDVIYVFDSQDRAKFDLVHCLTDLLPLDERDDARLSLRAQSPRILISLKMIVLDHLHDRVPRLFAHMRLSVQHTRYGSRSVSGFAGNVLYR